MVAVRVYTDASIKQGRGAWAAVIIRDDEEPVEFSGPLRGKFNSSAATEICAIANALHKGIAAGLICRGDQVAIYCDNEAAVMRVNGVARNRMKTDSRLIEAARVIRGMAKRRQFSVKAAHVKGHQPLHTVCPDGVFNLRCDELCSAIRDGREAPCFEVLLGRIARTLAYFDKREAVRPAISQEEAIADMRARSGV